MPADGSYFPAQFAPQTRDPLDVQKLGDGGWAVVRDEWFFDLQGERDWRSDELSRHATEAEAQAALARMRGAH